MLPKLCDRKFCSHLQAFTILSVESFMRMYRVYTYLVNNILI